MNRPAAKRKPRAAVARKARPKVPVVLTIGHSTRTIEQFIELLRIHGATRVADVRTVPRSRHNPQFNRDTLPASLNAAGIGYVHLPALGGLRRTTAASVNQGWRNASFRGYADYMQTPEFEQAVTDLVALAAKDRIVLMCAEAVPWRCHRSLIADALLVRGIPCGDIMSATRCQIHTLTPFARVRGTRITYPPEESATKPTSKRPAKKPPAKAAKKNNPA